MDFTYDDRTEELRSLLTNFIEQHTRPAEEAFRRQLGELDDRGAWNSVPVLEELRAVARDRGLWNLFLPASTAVV